MHLTLCVVVTKILLTCRLALMQWGSSIRLPRRLAWPRWGMMLGGFQGPRAANSLPKARPQRARRSAHAAVARSRRQEYPPADYAFLIDLLMTHIGHRGVTYTYLTQLYSPSWDKK